MEPAAPDQPDRSPLPASELSLPSARPPHESIQRRFVVTLMVRLSGMGLGFFTATFVPRALGPRDFGSFSFLTTATSTARGFAEPSVEQAVYTFSSQEERTGPLTRLYAVWLVGQLTFLVGFVGFASSVGFARTLWPGQARSAVLAITVLDWLTFGTLAFQQLGDSKGFTVGPQAIVGLGSLLDTAALLVLIAIHRLTFWSYVTVNLSYAALLCFALASWLLNHHADLVWAGRLRGRVGEYFRRWWGFARHLVLVEYYTPLVAYLGVYLIQRWYGSVEQAYLGLALRWSTLALVFTSSVISIFWRELAFAEASGNRPRAAELYDRFGRLLFAISLTVACWLAIAAPYVIRTAGRQFNDAVPVLAVMAFYPVQQTYGQLAIAAMKATGRTKRYRDISLLYSIPDLLLTYFLLAPRHALVPGLHLGALGVALRMVILGLVGIQAMEWSNRRFLGLNYWSELGARLRLVLIVGATGAVMMLWIDRLSPSPDRLPELAAASVLYFGTLAAVAWLRPELIGTSRAEIMLRLQAARRRRP